MKKRNEKKKERKSGFRLTDEYVMCILLPLIFFVGCMFEINTIALLALIALMIVLIVIIRVCRLVEDRKIKGKTFENIISKCISFLGKKD